MAVLDRYDAGLLGDGGGGDINWWQDYLRAELERADEFYQLQADALAAERDEALASLKVVRESLADQATARADPTMPILSPKVREDLRSEAEANYALAETSEERVFAHGLSLLCDWQDRAATTKAEAS